MKILAEKGGGRRRWIPAASAEIKLIEGLQVPSSAQLSARRPLSSGVIPTRDRTFRFHEKLRVRRLDCV